MHLLVRGGVLGAHDVALEVFVLGVDEVVDVGREQVLHFSAACFEAVECR